MTSISRTVLLDADTQQVRDALERPELLSAWLGVWTETGSTNDAGERTATVVTDDGRLRDVLRLPSTSDHSIQWRWTPRDDRSATSEVRIELLERGHQTLLVVHEIALDPAGGGATALSAAPIGSISWMPCLLALGAVIAMSSVALV